MQHGFVVDKTGKEIRLGPRVGSGGEGTVYELLSDPNLLAKVYKEVPSKLRAEKVLAQVGLRPASLRDFCAWPIEALYTKEGLLCGFVMPKVPGKPLHTLYTPASADMEFPGNSWAFRVYAARNLADAVNTVHSRGHIVGDLNENVALVSGDATIKLIDCDSFQVRANSKVYCCEVGSPLFTPPELFGHPLDHVVRTPNHDAFGFAVLCFHLLFMGRHPFAGKYAGGGEMPIEKAIQEGRFAYGRPATGLLMSPPPHSLSLDSASRSIAGLFEGAFSTAGRTGGRPTPQIWLQALERLRAELAPCGVRKEHIYWSGLNKCPWCEMERNGGPAYFVTIGVPSQEAPFDLAAVWVQIVSVPAPPAFTATTWHALSLQPVPKPLPAGVTPQRDILSRFLLWLGLWSPSSPYRKERDARIAAMHEAEAEFNKAMTVWQREVATAWQQFASARHQLEKVKSEYENLKRSYEFERQQLARNAEDSQRRAYLRRILIHHASIPGIGPGRKATLASYGIQTAADISHTAVDNVPGFGPQLTQALLSWQAACLRGFRFDPLKGVDPQAVAAVRSKYVARLASLQQQLLAGPDDLRRITSALDHRRSTVFPRLLELQRRYQQARADASVV